MVLLCSWLPGAANWTTAPNVNYVYDAPVNSDPHDFPTLGHPSNAEACAKLCQADVACHAYTWHDSHQPKLWALRCVGQ